MVLFMFHLYPTIELKRFRNRLHRSFKVDERENAGNVDLESLIPAFAQYLLRFRNADPESSAKSQDHVQSHC